MIDQQTLKNIEDLHRLKGEGVITEDEFEKAKAKLLFGPKTAASSNPVFATATGASSPPPTPAMEDLVGWVSLPLKRYADFQGRSSRREYWLFQLALIVAGIAIFVVIGGDLGSGGGFLSGMMILFTGIALLGLIVPLLALQVRRFHDQDKSGWFVLINFVPYIGSLIVLIMMAIEGDKGDNQYGVDPLLDMPTA